MEVTVLAAAFPNGDPAEHPALLNTLGTLLVEVLDEFMVAKVAFNRRADARLAVLTGKRVQMEFDSLPDSLPPTMVANLSTAIKLFKAAISLVGGFPHDPRTSEILVGDLIRGQTGMPLLSEFGVDLSGPSVSPVATKPASPFDVDDATFVKLMRAAHD